MSKLHPLKPSYVLDAWLVARKEYLDYHTRCCEHDPNDDDMESLDQLLHEWEAWSDRVDRVFKGETILAERYSDD